MKITSSAFQDGSPIPAQYAYHGVHGGRNISLPFAWTDPPAGTRSFALSIIDPHPVAKNWVHWCVVNIPPTTHDIPEGVSTRTMPAGSMELFNTYGTLGYGGPEPPKGSGPHPYVVSIFALNTDAVGLNEKASLSDFIEALKGKLLGSATITGYFER